MEKLNAYQDTIKDIADGDVSKKINDNIKILPKGVATNILCFTPFTYFITNSRPARNSDVFLERSTSIFGTTTAILQIFNILNCTKLKVVQERFVKIIYNVLNNLNVEATKVKNESFITIVASAMEQFKELLIIEPKKYLMSFDDDSITKIMGLLPAQAARSEPESTHGESLEKVSQAIEQGPPISGSPSTGAQSTEESEIRKVFREKNLFVKSKSVNAESFKNRVEEIRSAGTTIQNLFNNIALSYERNENLSDVIKTAYENEIFIKGFIGLFAFMKYLQANTGKKIPALFVKKQGVNQSNVLERLFGIMYLNLNSPEDDTPLLLEEIATMKQIIKEKLPDFDFGIYKEKIGDQEKQTYIHGCIASRPVTREIKNELLSLFNYLEKYINYCQQIEEALTLDPTLSTMDTTQGLFNNKSDFSVNSFQKLLEMNVVALDAKELQGKFEGINANEINANMALLYFIENRIAAMNTIKNYQGREELEAKPVPHPELVGLFEQLFKGSGIYSREYMTGGGDDLFNTMNELFLSNDATAYNEYRKNAYLLLNMPTRYDIVANNFQSYPTEIRLYLQNLNREYNRGKSGEEQKTKLSNIFSQKSRLTGFSKGYENPNIFQSVTPQVKVGGGKTKKNNKFLKNRKTKNKKAKGKKITTKNKINKHKKTHKIKKIYKK